MRRCWTIGAALFLFACFFPAAAHAAPLERGAVERWADGYFRDGLAKTGLPGAVIAVVQDGKPVLLKAYGVADAVRRTPIDTQRTLFRVGSITKVFTAIVALQLAREGRLDLNRDVNFYLKRFQVPETYARPITADILLAHAGGFAEDRRGRYGFDAVRVTADPPPMAPGELARMLAPRVRAPGLFSSYDNHGFGLLALVETAIDGTSFRAMMRKRIFAPLGM
ncbi:MAG TPA: serine hydrolase domain-containing protein, partial [Rhizomicrobium sp.]